MDDHRRRPVAKALLTLLAGFPLLVVPAAGAVTGGAPDGAAHPYAVGIIRPGASSIGCSGVLVQPPGQVPVVLTAAHCVYGSGALSGRAAAVFTGTTRRSVGARFHVDPRYQPGTHLHDLAVLSLDSPAPVAGAAVAPVGTLDRPPSSVTTVGYGDPYRGQRRQATELLVRVSPDWLFLRQGTGNSCGGDSGGPDLLPGRAVVVALTDQGSCTDSQDLRLDTVAAHTFITQVAAASVPARLSQAHIALGQATSLRVAAPVPFRGRTVLRQGWYAGAWHTWSRTVVGSNGVTTFTITPTRRATDHYRVLLPASGSSPSATSATVDLVVS